VLLTEAGGESASDYESDPDDQQDSNLPGLQRGQQPIRHKKEGDMIGEYAYRRDRIFKYITV